jgi:flavin reductase (DIM6/NTAB) family NADH-FMN oxidoreductase RutF
MTDIGAALGRIPSGIFILTVKHGEKRTGILVSWVMQAAFEPPMFTVAINRKRYLADWLQKGAHVALNILRDDEKQMISHFGRGFEEGENAFVNLELLSLSDGVPVLAEALAFLEGKVTGCLETNGDHLIFAITVQDGRILGDGAPMIHVRKNGMNY